MSIVRWDGLNKGSLIVPSDNGEVIGGQRYRWFKVGTISVYITLNEMDNLINGLVDCQEDERKAGHWPPPEPNR